MNEILPDNTVALDHFVLGLDDEGNEVKIKIDEAGELHYFQDIEDEDSFKDEAEILVH